MGDIPEGFQVIHGEYYQSPHFTLEYELFLKFKPTKSWWYSFKRQNNLVETKATDEEDWKHFSKHLDWFKPNNNFTVYKITKYKHDRSRYFIDYKTGVCYVYETQGM